MSKLISNHETYTKLIFCERLMCGTIYTFAQKLNDKREKCIFQVATHFSNCFENCFESVVLPEKFSGSTTDNENNFSWSLDKKKIVCFDLKSHVWGF